MPSAGVTEQPEAHLTIEGDGDRAVLFLHGWGASGELFAPVLQPLRGGRRLIVPDLPGFGGTPPPPSAWSAHEYAAWAVALLDRLGVTACDVIGHSNGGRVAIVMAANHALRVRRVVLVDSAGVRPSRSVADRMRVRAYKALRAMQRSRVLPASLRSRAGARADRRGSEDYRATSGTMRGTLVRLVNEDLAPLLPSVHAPVLLIWGERDKETPLSDAHTMERLIPDAGLVVFERSSHYSYLEQPARFCRIVDVFLRAEER